MKPPIASLIPLSVMLGLSLTACDQQELRPVAVQLPEVPAAGAEPLRLRTLSTKPWLVTGGDVLLEIQAEPSLNLERLTVRRNGEDVTPLFRADGDSRRLGLVTGLNAGDNTLTAALDGGPTATLVVTNFPVTGPVISGPHEQPFYCQSEEFRLVSGELLGPPLDADCSVATRVDYVYRSATSGEFLPYQPGARYPEDLQHINLPDGDFVPYIVRVETGTVNRAIYEIAMLHDPARGTPDAFTRSAGWNGKLVYTHGGGCRSGWYQQGRATGGVLREGLLEMGYAVTSATLNVFGQNCNDLLASETHIMVKERFIEHYGEPIYTIATGGSGGSYQSHQTADNYPGVFDGIIVSSSFPDVTSATIFTLADARLLHYYFTVVNQEGFTVDQQRAVSGFGSWGSIPNLARGAARLDPLYGFDTPPEEQGGEVSLPELEARRYQPGSTGGVRATVYDHTVNVYGLAPEAPVAARPLDNTGVQYGLKALNDGVISVDQFIALNRDIGGFDRDMNHVPQRHRADAIASRRAIESGRILFGGAGLATTPVIDYRSYTDHREDGDIHMIVHQFTTRQRMLAANGHADNHVMSVGGLWGFSADEPDLGELFRAMDQWLMGMRIDSVGTDAVARMVNARPAGLSDNCWDYSGTERINVRQTLDASGQGHCGEIYPVYSTPRQVAGAPLSNDIISCVLKPLDRQDYAAVVDDAQWQALQSVFPDGVCDWNPGDAHGASYQGTWQSFGPSPVNLVF